MLSNSTVTHHSHDHISASSLDEVQREAINLCCDTDRRLTAVTGAAGTGKTTIIRAVRHLLIKHGYPVAVCAPTGKAAKRIQEATGIEAKTIHRLLEFNRPSDEDELEKRIPSAPARTAKKPLPYQVVIVDESAMVATELYRQLIDALPPGGLLRMFGDENQLQPIEPNGAKVLSPFKTLLNAQHIRSVRLTHIYRQGEGSGIVKAATSILKGQAPQPNPDFVVKLHPTPILRIGELCRMQMDAGGDGFDKLDRQVICPAKGTNVGSNALNKVLSTLYDPGGKSITLKRHDHEAKKYGQDGIQVKVGSKVIVTANYYDLRQTQEERKIKEHKYIEPREDQCAFNGETGLVVDIEDGFISIDLGDRVVTFPPWLEIEDQRGVTKRVDPRKDIDLAYAITTHKAQGSEWDTVLYLASRSSHGLHCRANFYTGVTRARKKTIVLADEKSYRLFLLRAEAPEWKR